jgi:anti-sigma regulatory factor (Ser/Thr protein kinase)
MTGERPSVVNRLEAALTEQARLTAQYERAVGTSMELSSFTRLHTANLRVGLCQRAVDHADPPRAFAFSIAGGVEAPAEARNRVADGLNGALDDAMRETLRLLVSEVATNCVQHANADADARIDVAVSLPPGAVRVELSTAGAPFESPPVKPVRPGPEDHRGRGLFIVDSLARAWGSEPRAANRVWFELATNGAGQL